MALKMSKRAKQAQFLNIFPHYLYNISLTCKTVGISRRTFYKWMCDPHFSEQVNNLVQERHDAVESKLFEKAISGHTRCLLHYSQRFLAERHWEEQQRIMAEMRRLKDKRDTLNAEKIS